MLHLSNTIKMIKICYICFLIYSHYINRQILHFLEQRRRTNMMVVKWLQNVLNSCVVLWYAYGPNVTVTRSRSQNSEITLNDSEQWVELIKTCIVQRNHQTTQNSPISNHFIRSKESNKWVRIPTTNYQRSARSIQRSLKVNLIQMMLLVTPDLWIVCEMDDGESEWRLRPCREALEVDTKQKHNSPV